MKYVIMTIPDNTNVLGLWLDGVVARGEVAQLVDELAATHGKPASVVAEAPGEFADIVRERGFAGLSESQLQQVLANPNSIVALAEDALIFGGSYWNQQFAEAANFEDRITTGRQRLMDEIAPAVTLKAVPSTLANAGRRSISPWLVSLATAAVVLIAVTIYPGLRVSNPVADTRNPTPDTHPAWGWQKAEELQKITQPADYYAHIADLADEWNKQDTSTAIALAQRITEFRQGCAKLQLMDHKTLNDNQRKELLAKCQKWAKKFDASLIELETTQNVAKVKDDMTATVTQLVKTLRAESAKQRTA